MVSLLSNYNKFIDLKVTFQAADPLNEMKKKLRLAETGGGRCKCGAKKVSKTIKMELTSVSTTSQGTFKDTLSEQTRK